MEYVAMVSRDGRGWLIEFPDAPGCNTCADSEDEIAPMALDALTGWLEAHLITGSVPPRPKRRAGGKGLRMQVNAALATAIELRWARQDRGLSQAELATLAGVSQQQIAKLEKPGENPSIATLTKIGAALGRLPVVTFVPLYGPIGVPAKTTPSKSPVRRRSAR